MAIAQWAQDVYSLSVTPDLINRKVLTGAEGASYFGKAYAFVPLGIHASTVMAVAVDRCAATKYAAGRLRQDAGSMKNAPDLFLRLMSEHAARNLWIRTSSFMAKDFVAESAAKLTDLAGGGNALEDETSYLFAHYTLGGGDEDSWLLEGDESPPEVYLAFRVSDIQKVVRQLQSGSVVHVQAEQDGRDTLRKRVRGSTVVLDAVLHSVSMTIGECSRLEVGQIIALPDVKMNKLDLCAETVNGSLPISQGELGAWKGQRALKLHAPVPEDVIKEIAEI
ncbi:hypothetical protein HY29_06720 [Hyphomonas beringensis]|uniref:Flagellar motor switch protein FliN-like C-terminal domain-containing protein n=1 Tax=Hyphomonas beringensis TaxID=1280946 RepID=A0A062U4E8_9PROT|nr:FliM/FliN family flagellar motor switch protein [Hyphomonas beringensis]KCZ51040.1 hypothetical protein HY29_06720 [Hyphomonas beringensis]